MPELIWAVHISDGALTSIWLLGGTVLAIVLATFGAWRIRDEEIPQIALLTAAFYVASLLHVPVGGTSAHLLLNGLLGVMLGRRAALAIPVGLMLQAALMRHGGFTTLGINSCVMVLPALAAGQLFALLRRVPWVRSTWFRAALVALSTLLWILSLLYSVILFVSNFHGDLTRPDTTAANAWTFHPAVLAGAVLLSILAAWVERRMENSPEFPVGLLIGELTVLCTVLFNCLVLALGGLDRESWSLLALVQFILHLPIAVMEGTVMGFLIGFLVRVKPQMVGWTTPEKSQCTVDPLP